MFIAMNRFKIVLGKEKEFEDVWKNRDTHLKDVPGFKEFHLVKGDTNDEHTLYASHSIWNSKMILLIGLSLRHSDWLIKTQVNIKVYI